MIPLFRNLIFSAVLLAFNAEGQSPAISTAPVKEPGGSASLVQLLSNVGVTVGASSSPASAESNASTLLGQSRPASFVYGGESSNTLLGTWPKEEKLAVVENDRTIYETTWREPNGGGFVATWHVELFRNWPAMEFRWIFSNAGKVATKPLTQVQALDLNATVSHTRFTRLFHSSGGMSGGPPDAGFNVKEAPLGGWSMSSVDGRSSDGDLPFYVVHVQDPNEGLFVGIGWSGQWQAASSHDFDKFHLTAGMPDVNIALPPGERIISPSILLGVYAGPWSNGMNLLRRMLYAKYTPLIDGAKPPPPVSWNSWFRLSNDISDDILKAQADRAAAAGVEYFCIDSGWFEGGFPDGVGNWLVDKKKFPQGLGTIGNYVAGKGMKLGLWFEPERVANNTRLVREHPEWIHGNVVDFGNPALRDWIFAMMKGFIDEGHVQWIRWDFNFRPLTSWNGVDAPDQRGLTQIRHVMGLYDLLDRLMKAYPNLFIEGCASGGLRIDLETVKRSHTFWISDETENLLIQRFHETGANVFLPAQALNTNLMPNNFVFDPESGFGGALGFGLDWMKADPEKLTQLAKQIAFYKELRPLLNEDYYPLFPQDVTQNSWVGWQFYSPTHEEGFIVVLRPADSPFNSAQILMHGLDAAATYQLTPRGIDAADQKPLILSGAELNQGFALELKRETTAIFRYAKMK